MPGDFQTDASYCVSNWVILLAGPLRMEFQFPVVWWPPPELSPADFQILDIMGAHLPVVGLQGRGYPMWSLNPLLLRGRISVPVISCPSVGHCARICFPTTSLPLLSSSLLLLCSLAIEGVFHWSCSCCLDVSVGGKLRLLLVCCFLQWFLRHACKKISTSDIIKKKKPDTCHSILCLYLSLWFYGYLAYGRHKVENYIENYNFL